jgi:hypothetical protein
MTAASREQIAVAIRISYKLYEWGRGPPRTRAYSPRGRKICQQPGSDRAGRALRAKLAIVSKPAVAVVEIAAAKTITRKRRIMDAFLGALRELIKQ